MTSHVALMVLFAFFVSVVFATLLRDEPRDQAWLGAKLLGGFVLTGLALGWLLFIFPL